MRGRLLAGVMALELVLLLGAWGCVGAASGAPGTEPGAVASDKASDARRSFWWDVADTGTTTESSGTGGSPADAPAPEDRGFTWGYTLSMLETEYPAAWRGLTAYLGTLEEAFDCAPQRLDSDILDGRLLVVDLWAVLWDTTGLHGEEYGGRSRDAVFDLETGERLALSDLFYDGFNYIEYINEAAALGLSAGRSNTNSYPLGEESLRRPFTGFPADYPYFSIARNEYGGRLLVLAVNRDNPLFSVGIGGAYLAVPLRAEHSPYGLPWADITMRYGEAPMPAEDGFLTERPARFDPEDGGPDTRYFSVRADLGRGKDDPAQRAIDGELEALLQRALAHPLRYLQDADRPLAPYVSFDERGRLWVAYYAIVDRPDYGSWHMALLGGVELDLATGEALDGRLLRDTPGAATYLREEGELFCNEVPPEELPLGSEAMYLGAWSEAHGGARYLGAGPSEGKRAVWAAWLESTGVETYFAAPVEE